MRSIKKEKIIGIALIVVAFCMIAASVKALDPTSLPNYMGTYTQFVGPAPTGATIAIGTSQGTVTVPNFYAANPPVVDGDTVIIKNTDNYAITYDFLTSEFWLAIIGTPFQTYQQQAEQDFLTTMNLSQADACKLDVTSGVIYSAGNPLDGESFPLSFCAGQ